MKFKICAKGNENECGTIKSEQHVSKSAFGRISSFFFPFRKQTKINVILPSLFSFTFE